MTEAEWLAATDPDPLLEHVRREASDRKVRLFACAWGYDVWKDLLHECSREAVVVAERYADGSADLPELLAVFRRADRAGKAIGVRACGRRRMSIRLEAGLRAAMRAAAVARTAAEPGRVRPQLRWGWNATTRYQLSAYLRDIVGNPFRPAVLDPSWRTSTVVALAQQMYDSRDFAPIPVLADALMDAGCEDAALLAHCRGDTPHVRGCWVVDLILGKE